MGVTVCQTHAIWASLLKRLPDRRELRKAHAEYMATVVDAVIRRTNALVCFIPHSLEPGDLNDVQLAREVAQAMTSRQESFVIMEDDLSPRMLKGIIGQCDFLIGQRAHSIIGSASVCTPFVGVFSSSDRRAHDIFGEMCGCEEQLIDMDKADANTAAAKVVAEIERREQIRAHLERKMAEFRQRLADVALLVRG